MGFSRPARREETISEPEWVKWPRRLPVERPAESPAPPEPVKVPA